MKKNSANHTTNITPPHMMIHSRILKVRLLSFISEDEIKKRFGTQFESGELDPGCLSGASYDLRLGSEVLITPEREPAHLKEGQTLNIRPGQFAVLTTKECLDMPDDLLGFITVKFKYKSKGLVNISGFHVDPGFEGKLVFSVYNVGPSTVTLRSGDSVFSVFFAEIRPKTHYKGGYNKQKSIPLDIIETFAGARIPSIHDLEEKVDRNWTVIKIYGTILTGLVVAIVGAILRLII